MGHRRLPSRNNRNPNRNPNRSNNRNRSNNSHISRRRPAAFPAASR